MRIRVADSSGFGFAVAGLVLAVVGTPPPAAGEECAAGWAKPYVCAVELYAGRPGERLQRAAVDDRFVVRAGESLELEVDALDQHGRRFPADRFSFEVELDRRCGGLLTVAEGRSGTLVFTAGGSAGSCDVWLWVPGNQNLEWRLAFAVASRQRSDYSREEAEWIVHRLYEAILGRAADPGGLQSSVAEIQRGRLDDLVEVMIRSPEFISQRRGLPAVELLEDLYQGLLGRPPDSAGMRTYLDEVERGRHASVARAILRSEEFEDRLLREAGR